MKLNEKFSEEKIFEFSLCKKRGGQSKPNFMLLLQE